MEEKGDYRLPAVEQQEEAMRRIAECTAGFYQTLRDKGVPVEVASELTNTWIAITFAPRE